MRSAELPESRDPRKPLRLIKGRDELNLAEFPLTVLCKQVSPEDKIRVFEDRIRDQGTGELITRRLTISADEQSGLPTPLDDDVIIGLIQITKEVNNFTERTVPFSRYQLIELLGWPDSGQSFRRVDESLHRWLGVTLRYENAWWDKAVQAWVDESFHMLDNLTLYHQDTIRRIRKGGHQSALPFSSFSWNRVVFRSFQAENLKRLDLSLYFTLDSPAAKRAYRFLDKRFYRNPQLAFDLRDFAYEHIGLSRNHTAAKIKEKLQPAIEELEAIGFLEPLSRNERYLNVSRGEWKIVLIRGQSEAAKPAPTPQPIVLTSAPPPVSKLETALITRGVTAATARELAASHPDAEIQVRIEAFDWLVARKDRRISKSPGGYLADSIRKGYAAPKGFESKADRAKREEQEQVKSAQQKQAGAATNRQDAAGLEAEDKAFSDFWEALPEGEREAFRADALKHAPPYRLKRYCQMPDKSTPSAVALLNAILEQHFFVRQGESPSP